MVALKWGRVRGGQHYFPLSEVDSLHFNPIFILSFQIQCAGKQSQINKKCDIVRILTDCIVHL